MVTFIHRISTAIEQLMIKITRIIILTIIQMQEKQDQNSENCYFCRQADIGSCVTRSLYHKYNDSSNKLLHRIDDLVISTKQRSKEARKYEQIRHLVDDNDHLNKFLTPSKARKQLLDLLEYYKFRKFVPVFVKSLDNLSMTEQLHVYYYDKLKLYYNEIKRRLNITVEQSSVSSSEQSLITKSEISSNQSKILNQITSKPSKQSMRQYETQSKALEDLMNVLKKNQDRLNKIKSLKTQDCSKDANQFKDNIQRKSNLISYLASEAKVMTKKSKKIFFKYIDDLKSQRNVEHMSKGKTVKKSNGQISRSNFFSESLKIRANSQSVYRLRKQNSKFHNGSHERLLFRNKILLQRSQQRKSCQNLIEKQAIKSLPKVQMNFNLRPSRSMSSTNIGYPNQQNSGRKKIVLKKQAEYNQSQGIKQVNNQQYESKKSSNMKTPYKSSAQIDQNDNLASINRKKIEELKMKSQRKKQSRK